MSPQTPHKTHESTTALSPTTVFVANFLFLTNLLMRSWPFGQPFVVTDPNNSTPSIRDINNSTLSIRDINNSTLSISLHQGHKKTALIPSGTSTTALFECLHTPDIRS
ncbi:ATP-dependent RNA helicase dhx29-like [Plakobranchus ocellatus]|uniref:ATP-dependent RNA helicase dhx29-like n=1 Tax=Plakobranchus ocellatus TaxID=259542 RepID=A0AAV4ANE0_9GAST|nr:ATP-dependent RNA helicase dhx29-like [Plakobranchus ocellatus]